MRVLMPFATSINRKMPMRWIDVTRCTGILLFSGLLGACAPLHQGLSPEHRAQVRELQIQVVVPQEGILFVAPSSGIAAMGGLIPALIDAGIQKSRQEALVLQMQPFLDAMLDVDMRDEARAALAGPLPVLPFRVSRTEVGVEIPTKKMQEQRVARAATGEAVLRMLMHYNVDASTGVLTSRSQLTLWQPGSTGHTYGASAVYQGRPPRPVNDVPAAARAQMREAVLQTLKLAAIDLSHPATQGQRPRQSFPFQMGSTVVNLSGELLGAEGDRLFVRNADGVIFSVLR